MLSLLIASMTLLIGCSIERKDSANTDSAASAGAKTPPAEAPPGTSAPTATDWTVTPTGIGPLRAGMSADELRRVSDFSMPAGGLTACTYVRPVAAPAGVSVMLADGRVARVDVDSVGVRTDAGIAVGDSAARVAKAYSGRVTTMPHKYVQGGEYLIVKAASPADSAFRIVFEAEAGRITRLRSGREPEVEWVERCG